MRSSEPNTDTKGDWNSTDWLLGLGCGLVLLCASESWLVHSYSSGSSFSSADFEDYCLGLVSLLDSDTSIWPLKRSRLAALPAALVSSHLGILGALRFGAQLSTCVVGFCIYGWARLLAGRGAGVASVGTALALAPICLTPKLLSFYPFMTACLVLGAFLTTMGLLSSKPKGFLWVGTACAIALCADVRGLVWAAPWGLAGAWCALRSNQRLRNTGLLLLPILLSLPIGRWAYPEDARSLESQVDARPLFYKAGSTNPAHAPPYDEGGSFVWGRSTPFQWPATVLFVARQSQLKPPPGFPPANTRFTVDNRVKPLIPIWIGASVLSLILLFRKPRSLLALASSAAPFALAFRAQLDLAEIFLRFQAQLLPGLCILVGVCLGCLSERIPLPPKLSPLRPAALFTVFLLLVSGVVSTPVSRHARWRRPWVSIDHLQRYHPDTPAVDLNETELRCTLAMERDQKQGRWTPPSSARRTR